MPGMPATAIRNRRDLARHLQDQMTAARLPWPPPEAEEESPGRTHVKTYLVEAHAHDAPSADPKALLADIAVRVGAQVSDTDDADLAVVRQGDNEYWIDISDRRFWRLHTIAPVKVSDPLRDALVEATPWVDRVWLPPSLLESLPQETGSDMLTFSLVHDRRPLTAEGSSALDANFYVSMRLWATRAAETLKKLRTAEVFPHGTSVRSVQLRIDAEDAEGEFCVAEYFNHGKVTATGTSFDQHNRVLLFVIGAYRRLVEGIEERYGMGYEGDPPRLVGDPIVIEMQWTVQDLQFAVQRIFANVDPFRLWGQPEKVADGHYRARAVDLHIGCTLTLDITRDRVVVQLPRGTCGNTVLRFLSNLEYHVNSEAGEAFFARLGGPGTR